jgi:hypothetical protein
VAACAVFVVAFFTLASPSLTDQAGRDSVGGRVLTFANLENDSSTQARTQSTEELLREAAAYPIGDGLGLIGTATQLTSFTQSINSIDGGLQARLVEMGFAGFIGYVGVVLLAFGFVVSLWLNARRSGDRAEEETLSVLLAAQAALIILDFSVDSHVSLSGALFWLTVGIAFAPRAGSDQPVRSS